MTKVRNPWGPVVVAVLALALTTSALAQDGAPPPQALAELRSEAQRLTALAEVPAAGRADAESLLARIDAYAESAEALEVARLQAYIAALRGGDSPAVAREVAGSAIGDDSVALSRERESLLRDVRAFVELYPESAPLFASSRLRLSAGLALADGAGAQRLSIRRLDGGAVALGPRLFLESPGHDEWQRIPGHGFMLMLPYGSGR